MPKIGAPVKPGRSACEVRNDRCIACEGSGRNSRGDRCYPCQGTGKKQVKKE